MAVIARRTLSLVSLSILITVLIAAPGYAQDGEPPTEPEATTANPEPQATGGSNSGSTRPLARVKTRLKGLSGGKVDVGEKFKVKGTVAPWVAGQKITIITRLGKNTIETKRVTIRPKAKRNYGTFEYAKRVTRPGKYRVRTTHKKSAKLGSGTDTVKPFSIRYPSLGSGSNGSKVRLMKRMLKELGYVPGNGGGYSSRAQRAVLAYRKVNGLSRSSTKLSSKMFKKLADGKGGFKLSDPGLGHHVEIDISRQVMVLADGKKVERIYHISSGAPATPTIRGYYTLGRREPGYNNIEMYYSTYFYGGYAIHGYKSVPTYNASHGCVRAPIPDAVSIYNWINNGDKIHVYN